MRAATSPAQRRRAARAWRRCHALWLAVFLAGLGLGASLGPRLAAPVAELCCEDALRLREVTVVGAQRVTPAQVARAAGLEPAARLDRLEPAELAGRIEAHPWIARARVAVLAPGRLMLAVEEREPVATARLASRDDAAWWVDDAGVPFAPVEDLAGAGAFPQIGGADHATPGRPDLRLAQAVRVAGAARQHGLRGLREVQVGGGEPAALPTLRLVRPPGRILLGGGDLDAKLARLARLLAAELPEVQAASAIDLRFGDRTVLRSDASWTGDAEAGARGSALSPGTGPAG